jgi:hypothetical protein
MDQKNYVSLGVTFLGAIKLSCESFGLHFISNVQIDGLANVVSVGLVIAGIVMTHIKKKV